MTYHYHGIDAEESILTKSLSNLETWVLPNLFFVINARVTEVSLPKWSLGSPHSDVLSIVYVNLAVYFLVAYLSSYHEKTIKALYELT